MKEKLFDSLRESVMEAGQVLRGERAASREFVYEVEPSQIKKPEETWAVCIDTDDEELLIPRKLYRVQIFTHGVLVKDEKGEATICPKEFFLPVTLPVEVEEVLGKVA